MQETDQGNQEQQEGKQREQHLVRQCRRVGGHLVVDEFLDGAYQHLVQLETIENRKDHSVSFRRKEGEIVGDSGAVFYIKVAHMATLKQFRKFSCNKGYKNGHPWMAAGLYEYSQ